MNIRPAAQRDIPAVLPMVAATCALHEAWDAAKYGFLPNPSEMYRGWLTQRTRDPRSVFLVAEHVDSRIVAFIVATIERDIPIYRVEQFGFIHDLWVEPAYRHEGLGRQLVMESVARLRELGVAQVRLDTAAPNDAARALFARCGFRVSAIEMVMELT